jgi:hypothetical protein
VKATTIGICTLADYSFWLKDHQHMVCLSTSCCVKADNIPLSKIIDLRNKVLNFAQKEGESLGEVWSRYNQLALSGPELSILDAMLMQHFVSGLGKESAKYSDMSSWAVF